MGVTFAGGGGTAAAAQAVAFKQSAQFFGKDLLDVAYGGSVYAAVGGDGAIVRSIDGDDWKTVGTGIKSDLKAVVYGNGRFVATGEDNTLLVSADRGQTWTKRSLTLTPSTVPGLKETEPGVLSRSKEITHGSVVWDGKRFVVLTQMKAYVFDDLSKNSTGYAFVSTSADGLSWKTSLVGPYVYEMDKIKVIDGVYYAMGQNRTATSRDLKKWTTYEYGLTDIASGPGGKVALWERLESARTRPAALRVSALTAKLNFKPSVDLTKWSEASQARSIDYINGLYAVNADKGNLVVSADGKTWSKRSVGTQDNTISLDRLKLNKTIWDGSRYVTVGAFGSIYTSTDLKKFDSHPVQGTAFPVGFDLYGIGRVGGQTYVYGSNGSFYTRENEKAWERPYSILPAYNVLAAYYDGRHIAVAAMLSDWSWTVLNNSYVLSVYDVKSETKEETHLSGNYEPYLMQAAGSTFAATMKDGQVYKYSDAAGNFAKSGAPKTSLMFDEPRVIAGKGSQKVKYTYDKYNGGSRLYYLQNNKWIKASFPTWSAIETYNAQQSKHTHKEDTFGQIIYGNNEFIAVGARGMVLRSKDGKTWTQLSTPTKQYLNGIVWDGNVYTIVGDKGTYLTSGPSK
ncbi:hypothetical protein QWJ34_21705 [Saccharibacillus sp. CPCC 101409]|uniref:hypothetical protein n=1 Tax=Saccharibacillus sp. CPCC 101409 TaxID=3058041 RepID=UPI002672F777|nr:hypothetical protein [Saccharibacillus sp. CPCC 101409]MDO3412395.1 hypothetical protein [Saccharibacillus sp. CPCC 101409]